MKTEYCFEVTLATKETSDIIVYVAGENIKDVYYELNDKVYNNCPVEIVKVERKQTLVQGYTDNKELNPNFKNDDELDFDFQDPQPPIVVVPESK